MTRLSSLLPFNGGETVVSYASRLAAGCGYRHARSFGFDLKFRFQDLAVGSQPEIDNLASILDVSPALLEPGVVRTSRTEHLIRGETLSRMQLRRQSLRFCPFCLDDDERTGTGRRGHRGFGRLHWLVAAIGTCRSHGVSLVTCEPVQQPVFIHDFAANLAAEQANTDKHKRAANQAEVGPLQEYVEARLERRPTHAAWLDGQPLHVAIRLCEILGATERHGLRFNSKSFDETETAACAGVGFQLLQGGEESLESYLVACTKKFKENSSGDIGGRFIFGRLYERLAHEITDVAYEPIRNMMLEVALNHLPLGPGDEFFGPVTERRLHSVQSASKEYGVHPKRLLKLLVNLGTVSVEDAGRSMERILVPAADMERISIEAGDTMGVPEAKEHLGVGRAPFELLVKHRIIVPYGGVRAETVRPVDRRFLVGALNDLLAKLDSAVNCQDDGTLCDLAAAAKRADCTFIEIIELLMNRSLTRVAKSAGPARISSMRVDPAELKERTRGEDHGCINLRSLEKLLPAKSSVVKALVNEGHLASVERQNPIKRHMQTVVEPGELDLFKKRYISLGSLSIEFETRTWTLEAALVERRILPAFTAAGSAFYLRAQVDELTASDLGIMPRKYKNSKEC